MLLCGCGCCSVAVRRAERKLVSLHATFLETDVDTDRQIISIVSFKILLRSKEITSSCWKEPSSSTVTTLVSMLKCLHHSLWLHSGLVTVWFKRSSCVSPKMAFNTTVTKRNFRQSQYWTSATRLTYMTSVMGVLIPSLEVCLKVPLQKWTGKWKHNCYIVVIRIVHCLWGRNPI